MEADKRLHVSSKRLHVHSSGLIEEGHHDEIRTDRPRSPRGDYER